MDEIEPILHLAIILMCGVGAAICLFLFHVVRACWDIRLSTERIVNVLENLE